MAYAESDSSLPLLELLLPDLGALGEWGPELGVLGGSGLFSGSYMREVGLEQYFIYLKDAGWKGVPLMNVWIFSLFCMD